MFKFLISPGLWAFHEYTCYLFFFAKSPDFSSPGLGNVTGKEACHWLSENSVTSAFCFIFIVQSIKCYVITRLDYLYSEAKEGKD